MTESMMHLDLLAAQQEMPTLQRTAINPHFGNKFIPLDTLLPAVLKVLNAHNLVLVQQPTIVDGQPALRTLLVHTSGEVMDNTMLLQPTKADPQQQGSAITYARRYSLLSWLGLVADVDDDAETHRNDAPVPPKGETRSTPAGYQAEKREGVRKPNPARQGHDTKPGCPQGHGEMRFWPAGTTKSGKPVGANYKCVNRNCDNGKGWPESVWATDWEDRLLQMANQAGRSEEGVAPDELPIE